MKQIIIVRKDLEMSTGKLVSQCCHASMAFLTKEFTKTEYVMTDDELNLDPQEEKHLSNKELFLISLDKDVYTDWIAGTFTKIVCGAKNKNKLMKSVEIAKELGLEENKDYFLIKDNCYTELEPEEVDENGIGRTLTCIGFRPLPDDIAQKISKEYQLLK